MSLVAAASILVGAGASITSLRSLGRRLGGGRQGRAVALGLALSNFLVVVPIVGRVARSFDAGLIAFAIASLGLLYLSARPSATEPTGANGPSIVRHLLAVGSAYGVLAWKYQMHDEHSIFGHKSMVEQLRMGTYPIHLVAFPEQEARYHVGFDVMAGALARAFDLSSDLSIDLVTVGMALLVSYAAVAVVEALGVAQSQFAAIAIHLGAGLAFVLLAGVEGRHPRCLVQYHHPSCGVELFPTPILNVFQHPVSVGVPLWLVASLLLKSVVERRSRSSAAALMWISPALAIGQSVYAALFALSAMTAALLAALLAKESRKNALTGALLLFGVFAASLVIARASGGMLTPSSLIDPKLIVWRRRMGFPENVPIGGILFHHVVNLGVGFLALPIIGLWSLRRKDLLLMSFVAFAVGGMLVPHLFTYTRSWDIVKFPSAAAFALTIVCVATVDVWLSRRAWLPFRRFFRIALTGSGALAVVFLLFPLPGDLELYATYKFEPDPIVAKCIDLLRSQERAPNEVIHAQANVAQQLAVFGGLPVTAVDYDLETQGIRAEILQRRRTLVESLRQRMDRTSLEELHVRFLVFSMEELDNLAPTARAALDADFEIIGTFSDGNPRRTRRVFRVSDSKEHSGGSN